MLSETPPLLPFNNFFDILFSMKKLTAIFLLTIAVLLGSIGVSYALPECPSDRSVSAWSDCFGIWTINTGIHAGYRYVGEWKDGKQNGQGTTTWSVPHKSAGEKYVGEYKDGKNNGQGTYTWSAPHKSAGAKYVGEWKDGKKNGQGTTTWSAPHKNAGEKYVGEYKDGKYNGQGTYTFPRGSKSAVCCEHVGKWKNGMPNGLGVHTYADGRIEEGMYKNGKFQYAQKVTPNKIVRKTSTKLGTCKGTYKPTWNNCIGTRTFNSGSKYSGQWRSGKEHGTGTLTYSDGEKYVGGFKNGMHHGNGTITSPNGKVMRGIWANDKFKSEIK